MLGRHVIRALKLLLHVLHQGGKHVIAEVVLVAKGPYDLDGVVILQGRVR